MKVLGTYDQQALKDKLLLMSREAVDAENTYLERSVVNCWIRGINPQTQRQNAAIHLDAYLETFDPEQPHDLQAELSAIVQTPVRLSKPTKRAFCESNGDEASLA